MKRKSIGIMALALVGLLVGCGGKVDLAHQEGAEQVPDIQAPEINEQLEATQEVDEEPAIRIREDWGEVFEGVEGSAVVFSEQKNQYEIYNQEMAQTRYSPCSTFKIISTLMGLETGSVTPDTEMTWSGQVYSNTNWNQDQTLTEAFQNSCVWYYRRLINQIDLERIEQTLEQLQYGNQDWRGDEELKGQSDNDTQGVWIDSTLEIAPLEQVEVLRKIFGSEAYYEQDLVDTLKEMMLTDKSEQGILYGKTGMGQKSAWFVGLYETENDQYYFAVRLERETKAITSQLAKEIARRICEHL